MKITYEGAILSIMRCGGIARYFRELTNRLPSEMTPIFLGPPGSSEGLTHPNLRYEEVPTRPPFTWMGKIWRPLQHNRIGRLIEDQHADLIHWTYYLGLCRRPIQRSGVPTVVTVYDFIHEAFPESDPKGQQHRTKAEAIKIADHICCISQTTFDELCERYPSAASRASITPLGSGLIDVDSAALPPSLRNRPFLLFVGRRGGYKNFGVVWKAWNQIKSTIPDAVLALVGPPIKKREQSKLGWDANDARVQLFANADDSLLKSLYQGCSAFVFPSKMEGFGLPVLEAMTNGAPLLASGCAALREVAGSAGYFFEHDDVDAVSQLMIAAANGSLHDAASKVAQGYRRAESFSWESTAQKTIQAYESLLNQNSLRRAA
jgi:glycosyltransferase involved in cell wall biosynthesis